jgi:hypothetical protein
MKNLRSLWLPLVSCDECDTSERQACLAAIAKLTQLRRLWLQGDLVTTGLAELTPLESFQRSHPGRMSNLWLEEQSELMP